MATLTHYLFGEISYMQCSACPSAVHFVWYYDFALRGDRYPWICKFCRPEGSRANWYLRWTP